MANIDFSQFGTYFGKWVRQMYDKYMEAGNAAAESAKKLAEKKGSEYAEERYRALFKETIEDFYNDYDPIDGGYERDYSMYNILVVNKDKDGRMRTLGFDESAMTAFRSGYRNLTDQPDDGLYFQVFLSGWHGGAASDGKKHKHPDPGTPYWRKPIPSYKHWGKQAEKTDEDEAPYDVFHRKVDEARYVGGDVHTHVQSLAQLYFNQEFRKELMKRFM